MAEETPLTTGQKVDVPKGAWTQCPKCSATVYQRDVEERLGVCPACGFHHRINARTRIEQLCDPGTFEELLADLVSTDPLKFTDRIPYKQRIQEVQQASQLTEAIIVGKGFIRGRAVILGVMDPFFIMASMGAVVGER